MYTNANAQVAIDTLWSPTSRENGFFGIAVSSITDVSGDGIDDILVGAGGEESGRVYVFSGRDRTLLYSLSAPDSQMAGAFGNAVAGVPDIDGDSFGDFMVGDQYHNILGPDDTVIDNAGRVFVFSGASGELLYTLDSTYPSFDGVFGWSVSSVPDTDGDGTSDLLVGAWNERHPVDADSLQGHTYLFSGGTGALLSVISPPARDNSPGGSRFGWSVSGVPDVDGDGRGDLLIGAWATSTPLYSAGRAYLYSGASTALLHTLSSSNPRYSGDFAYAVSGIPDINGDGSGELIIGAIGESVDGIDGAGRAYIFDGRTGTILHNLTSPYPGNNARFGYSASWLFDVDRDNIIDVAICAFGEGILFQSGRVHIFSGSSGDHLLSLDSPLPSNSGRFGNALAGISDLEKDGLGNLVVGAPAEGEPPTENAGRAYIFNGLLTTPIEPGSTQSLFVLKAALACSP